jgi:hypothetical protein
MDHLPVQEYCLPGSPHMRPDDPEEDNQLMDQLALHVLQGKGFLEPISDWHEGTLIPAWQRDRARDSAYAIASCFSQSAKIGQSAQNRSPAEVQAQTSDATPYFGSPAFTWYGAGTPGSEPDLRRCCFAVRFAVFLFSASIQARILRFPQHVDNGVFDERPNFETFARHSKGSPSTRKGRFQIDGTRRMPGSRREHAELIASISRERVLELMRTPQEEAARQLGICLTTFKKIYRGYVTPTSTLSGSLGSPPLYAVHNPPSSESDSRAPAVLFQGITKWPYRQLRRIGNEKITGSMDAVVERSLLCQVGARTPERPVPPAVLRARTS